MKIYALSNAAPTMNKDARTGAPLPPAGEAAAWHALSPEEALRRLDANEDGLADEEAARRLEAEKAGRRRLFERRPAGLAR